MRFVADLCCTTKPQQIEPMECEHNLLIITFIYYLDISRLISSQLDSDDCPVQLRTSDEMT